MKKKINDMQMFVNLFLILMSAIIIIPLLYVLSVSFSNEKDIMNYGYELIPRNIDLAAYKYVFKNPQSIINSYGVTALFSALSMAMGVLAMAMFAYPLSRRFLKGRKALSFYLYFTMLFSGGLVPSYILITQYLHLGDTIWVYVLPTLISPWHVFMLRTFFSDIPESLYESAYLDGASEYTIFAKIILPISKPAIATVALLIFLGKWNDWYTSMLYINEDNLISLQYLLQRLLLNAQLLQSRSGMTNTMVNLSEIPTETVKMAMAIVVAGPALLVFPFFQKYFVKGMTMGSVKG